MRRRERFDKGEDILETYSNLDARAFGAGAVVATILDRGVDDFKRVETLDLRTTDSIKKLSTEGSTDQKILHDRHQQSRKRIRTTLRTFNAA